MASSSSAVTAIRSVCMYPESDEVGGCNFDTGVLKIGLRNVRVLLLLCGGKADDDLAEADAEACSMLEDIDAYMKESEKTLEVVNNSVIVLEAELSNFRSMRSGILSLTVFSVDEIVWITDIILDNTADFLDLYKLVRFKTSREEFEAVETFGVHVRFIRNFLLFALRAGVDQLDHLVLFHIQPVIIRASRAFLYSSLWLEVAASKCSMATEPQVYQAYAHALCTSRPSYTWEWDDDDVLRNFLDSLISLLWDVLRHPSGSGIHDQLKALYEGLRFSRAILKDVWDDDVRGQIGDLICSAGMLICSLHQSDPEMLSDLLRRLDVLRAQVEVEVEVETKEDKELGCADSTKVEISDEKELEFDVHTTRSFHGQPPQAESESSTPQAVCFKEDEVTSILNRLNRGSRQLRRIPICGMAGLGKTTFASKLYNHPSAMSHFQARAWCTISQVLDKKKVLLHLLNQIHESGNYTSDISEEDLANKLRQNLKRKRYLIVLDDVWTPEVWRNLEGSFPNDSTDSRVILTSRRLDIAPHALPDEQPHLLRLREDNECLEILQAKLFKKEGWTLELGRKIAERCKGLPLTVVILAGLLATTEKDGWKGVLDDLTSGSLSGAESALELSYKHLPEFLQPCFLYLGAFSEDEEVSVRSLIQLWMAEEFVRKSNSKKIEDVAREYMEKLIARSLVMVARSRSIGGVSTYRIHDLVHDFCRKRSKQENLFHLLLQRHDQLSDFNEPRHCKLQRLVIHSSADHLKKSELFSPSALSLLFFSAGESWMESHLFDMSFIIQIFRILKVLDIHQICLTNGIPSSIELLTQLKYFSVQSSLAAIPSSIGNLLDLETFIADFSRHKEISFPDTIWRLHRLKYLYVSCRGNVGFTFLIKNLENSGILSELDTICGIAFCSDDGSMEKQLEKFPNIRRLKCSIQHGWKSKEESNKIVIPDFLSQLESLTIYGKGRLQCGFGSSVENLRKLKLDGFELSREDMSVIGKFPNLEVLKLSGMNFPDDTLEMEEDEFPNLRILILYLPYGLGRWTVSDDQLPCLQKLVFGYCTSLEEIPSCLGTIETLEEIQVLKCSSTLESLVRGIEEEQQGFGNSIRVQIKS